MEIRIIVAGSRSFDNFTLLCKEFSKTFANSGFQKEDIRIISGTARGADKLGERYAEKYGLKLSRFPADWETYGKRAGYIRNNEMAKFAVKNENKGILMAFWDGESKGTKHMIDLAKAHGLEVHMFVYG